jgi:hypothetical protein
MSKPRKKERPPKRILALPDLEQSKAAVFNTLTFKKVSAGMIVPSPISSIGTVQNCTSHSTAQWFCDTGSFSNRSSTQPQPSTPLGCCPACRV